MKNIFLYRFPNGENSGGSDDPKTDNTKLVANDTVYVSPDGGTTNESFPKQGVEYDFCVDVTNTGSLPSGAFYLHFTLSGDQNPPFEQDFKQDAGLDAGQSVKAVVHFGSFPNEFKDYLLEACIYSPSAPDTSINCAGTFDFPVNTESTDSNSSSDNSDSSDSSSSKDTSSSDDSSSSSDDSGSNDSSPSNDSSSSGDDSSGSNVTSSGTSSGGSGSDSTPKRPYTVESWRSLVTQFADGMPVEVLLRWIKHESGGNPCSTGKIVNGASIENGLF